MYSKKIKILLLGVIPLLVIGFILLLTHYNTGHPVRPDTLPELEISSQLLLSNFMNGNSDSGGEQSIRAEQILEVSGRVKEVNVLNNRITVLLKGKDDKPPYVICDMQPDQIVGVKELRPNDSVKVKGIFKGFLEDVILLDCIITFNRSNE